MFDQAESRLLQGIADIFDLGDDVDHFEILKFMAEKLDCHVDDTTGTTTRHSNTSSDESDDEEDNQTLHITAHNIIKNMSRPRIIDLSKQRPPNSTPPSIHKSALEYLFYPLDTKSILNIMYNHNHLRPLLIQRKTYHTNLYKSLFTSQDIKNLLYNTNTSNTNTNKLQYGYNVDVTKYINGQRHTYNSNNNFKNGPHSKEGELVNADIAWNQKYMHNGCSIRILHPQRYSDTLWQLVSLLESELNSCVGTNSYLTPAGSQGFAPHWDDIHACICQVEGKKNWKVYAPCSTEHVLPLRSSRDFTRDELGELIMDVVLEPGDFLFLPRGAVHEAISMKDTHSLHVTVSFDQGNSYSSFLRRAFMNAIDDVERSVVAMRQTLPGNTLKRIICGSDADSSDNNDTNDTNDTTPTNDVLLELTKKVYQHVDITNTATSVLTDVMLDRMPPPPLSNILSIPSKGIFEKIDTSHTHPEISSTYAYTMAGWNIALVNIEDHDDGHIAVLSHCCSNIRSMAAAGSDDTNAANDQDDNNSNNNNDTMAPPTLEFPIECIDTVKYLADLRRHEIAFFDEIPDPREGCAVSKEEIIEGMVDAGLVLMYRRVKKKKERLSVNGGGGDGDGGGTGMKKKRRRGDNSGLSGGGGRMKKKKG